MNLGDIGRQFGPDIARHFKNKNNQKSKERQAWEESGMARPPINYERQQQDVMKLAALRNQQGNMVSATPRIEEKNKNLRSQANSMNDDDFLDQVVDITEMLGSQGVTINTQTANREEMMAELERGYQELSEGIVQVGDEMNALFQQLVEANPADKINQAILEMIGRTRDEIETRIQSFSVDRLVDDMFEQGMERTGGGGDIEQAFEDLAGGVPNSAKGKTREDFKKAIREQPQAVQDQMRKTFAANLSDRLDRQVDLETESEAIMGAAQEGRRSRYSYMQPDEFATLIGQLRDKGMPEDTARQALDLGPQNVTDSGIGETLASFETTINAEEGTYGERQQKRAQERGRQGYRPTPGGVGSGREGAYGGPPTGGGSGGPGGGGNRPPGGGGTPPPGGWPGEPAPPEDERSAFEKFGEEYGPALSLGGALASLLGRTTRQQNAPMAASMAQGIPNLAGAGLGSLAGSTLGSFLPIPGVGTIAGGVIGGAIGHGVGKVASSALQPYLDFTQQQRGMEAMTGENLSHGAGAYVASRTPGSETVQGQVLEASLRNMTLPGDQIQQLAQTMLELGASTEEATEMIVPAAEAVNEFGVSAETVGTLMTVGRNSSPMGQAFGPHMAQRMQAAAQRSGVPQAQIEQRVMQAVNDPQMAGTFGHTGAATMSTAYSNLMGGGDSATDTLVAQMGIPESLMQGGVNAASDYGQSAILGLDPNVDLSTEEGQAALEEGQSNLIRRLGGRLTKDSSGQIPATPANLTKAQTLLKVEGQSLNFSSGQQLITAYNALVQNENAGSEVAAEYEAAGVVTDAQDAMASGEGTGWRNEDEESWGIGGMAAGAAGGLANAAEMFRGLGGGTVAGWLRPDTQGWDMAGSSSATTQQMFEESGGEGADNSLHALSTLPGMRAEHLYTESGSSIMDAFGGSAEATALLEGLKSGDEKIMAGDTAVTVEEFLAGHQDGSMKIDETTGLPVPVDDGASDETSGERVQVEFTGSAARFFEQVDTTKDGTMAGTLQGAQDDYAANTGSKQNNDRPGLGGT